MYRRIKLLAAIPVVVAVLTWGIRSAWDRWVLCPVLVYPAKIDLGTRERGAIAVERFAIANYGRGELVLDQFFTSCSCAGVEREVDGQLQRVIAVSVPPGEQVELLVRVSVGVPAGDSQQVQVGFDSNDPARPRGRIDLFVTQVKGGVRQIFLAPSGQVSQNRQGCD